jgi:hypothetical protein
MAARKPAAPAAAADVDALPALRNHPHGDAITALRELLRASDPAVREGVKWNSPSYRTTEWFATIRTNAKRGVQVILHLGARPGAAAPEIADPDALLQWLGKDRAMVTFDDLADVTRKRAAFVKVARQWVRAV